MKSNSCRLTRKVVLSCSGAYNVRQIANQAALALQQEGIAAMLCLTAVAAKQEDSLALIKAADRIVGIDGCERACTKKALQHAGLSTTDHVTVTGLSIAKKPHDDTIDPDTVIRVKNAVKGRLESVAGGQY